MELLKFEDHRSKHLLSIGSWAPDILVWFMLENVEKDSLQWDSLSSKKGTGWDLNSLLKDPQDENLLANIDANSVGTGVLSLRW